MHIYIKDAAVDAVRELLAADQSAPKNFTLQVDGNSGEHFIQIYQDPFSPTFTMRLLPADMVDRYSVRDDETHNPKCFRTNGVYRLNNAELSCKTMHYPDRNAGVITKQWVEVIAPTITALQEIYFQFRQGKLLPEENWEVRPVAQQYSVDPSKVIREVCPTSKRVVLRTRTYARDLGYILMLYAEAKKDFPELTPEQVNVVHFGGQHYAKTDGIEFEVNLSNVPKTYSEIAQLEFTR